MMALRFALVVIIVAMVSDAAFQTAPSLGFPTLCNSTNLSVATFGEYVWNCSSSSSTAGGGGGVLWIMVPPPAANSSGLLSVEVRLSTFGQIIVDLGNVVLPLHDVNVTIVLCGAIAPNGSSAPLLNFSDRPTTPVVMIINGSNNGSSSNTVGVGSGGVRVAVVLASGVALWMRNVSSLLTVAAFPVVAGWAEVALEVRSGCRMDLSNVRNLVDIEVQRMLIRIAFWDTFMLFTSTSTSNLAVLNIATPQIIGATTLTIFNCSFTIVAPVVLPVVSFHNNSSDSIKSYQGILANVAVSVLSSLLHISSGSDAGLIVMDEFHEIVNVTLAMRNTTVVVLASNNSYIVLMDSSNLLFMIHSVVALISSSHITLSGDVGCVIASAGSAQTVNVSSVSVDIGRSTVSFACNGYLIHVGANMSATVSSIHCSCHSRSTVTTSGSVGSLCLVSAPFVTLSNVTSELRNNSIATFAGVGYVAHVKSIFAIEVIDDIRIVVSNRSVVLVGGVSGALCCLDASNGTASVGGANVSISSSSLDFSGDGFIMSVTTRNALVLLNEVSISILSSNVSFSGGIGALCFCNAFNGTLTFGGNVVATLGNGTVAQFAGEGFTVLGFSLDDSHVGSIVVLVSSSTIVVSGSFGALAWISSQGRVVITATMCRVDLHSLLVFNGVAYIMGAISKASLHADNISIAMFSSAITSRGSEFSVLCLKSSNSSVDVLNPAIRFDGSSLTSANTGCLLYAQSGADLSVSHAEAILINSSVRGGGNVSTLCFFLADSGAVALSSVAVFLQSRSNVSFEKEGPAVYASAGAHVEATSVVACVASGSSLSSNGTQGALVYFTSTAMSVTIANISMLVIGSAINFQEEGYLIVVQAPGATSLRDLNVIVDSNSVFACGAGALCFATSGEAVVATTLNVTVGGGSLVSSAGVGYLILFLGMQRTEVSGIDVNVHSQSAIKVLGLIGALCFVSSPGGAVVVTNVHAVVSSGASLHCAQKGYLAVVEAATGDAQVGNLAAIMSSNSTLTTGGEGALCFVDARTASFHDAQVILAQASTATFTGSKGGYVLFVQTVDALVIDTISVLVLDSRLTASAGTQGAIAWMRSQAGAQQLINIAAVVDHSDVYFDGRGYLIFANALHDLDVGNVSVAMKSSSLIVGGSEGSICSFNSKNGSTALSSIDVYLDTSVSGFDGEGYIVWMYAFDEVTVNGSIVTIVESALTAEVGMGAMLIANSQVGAMSLSTVALHAVDSIVHFSQTGAILWLESEADIDTDNITCDCIGSNVTIEGDVGAVFFLSSSAGKANLLSIRVYVQQTTLTFSKLGYVLFGVGSNNGNCAQEVGVWISMSVVTIGGYQGAAIWLRSTMSTLSITRINLSVVEDTNFTLALNGSLIFANALHDLDVGNVSVAMKSSSLIVGGSEGSICSFNSKNGSTALSSIDVFMAKSVAKFQTGGYAIYVRAADFLLTGRISAIITGLSVVSVSSGDGAVCRLQSQRGDLFVANATIRVLDSSKLSFADRGYVLTITTVIGENISVHGIVVTISHLSNFSVSGAGALLAASASNGSASLYDAVVSMDGGSARFAREGYMMDLHASTNLTLYLTTASLASSVFLVDGKQGSLMAIEVTKGSLLILSVIVAVVEHSSARFRGTGRLVSLQANGFRRCDDPLVLATILALVSSSTFTVLGAAGDFVKLNFSHLSLFESAYALVKATIQNQSVVQLPPLGCFVLASEAAAKSVSNNVPPSPINITITVIKSLLVCKQLVRTALDVVVVNVELDFSHSCCVVNGDAALTEGIVSTVSLRSVESIVAIVKTSRDRVPAKLNILSAQLSAAGAPSLSSICGLIGWHGNLSTDPNVLEQWVSTVADKFFSGRLDGMPFPFRALRKLDVVGAARVAVTAERCAWGRGSHEFRATDSASGSLTLMRDGTTHTLQSTQTVEQLAVVRRSLVTARGIGSSVLFVSAASSVVSSSVSTVVPGVQAIGQRSALQRQCNAYSAADDGSGSNTVVPPLSDAASNPFGVTIAALGDELMFAGGSVVSSLLLALIVGTAAVAVAPLLRGRREWLRRMKAAPLATLRLPGSLYAPLALVLQPLTVAAVVLLASSSRSAGSVVFGLVLFVVTLAPLCGLLWRVWDGRRQQLLLCRELSQRQHDQSSLGVVVHTLSSAFGDRHECAPRSSNESASQRHFERYGVVVASYAAGREWFVGVEIAAAIVSGVLSGVASGLDPSVVCSASVMDGFNWALAALCIVLLVAVVILRPYSSHFGNVLSGLSSLLAAVCLALQSLSPDSPAIFVLTWVQSSLGYLPLVLAVLTVLRLSKGTVAQPDNIFSASCDVPTGVTSGVRASGFGRASSGLPGSNETQTVLLLGEESLATQRRKYSRNLEIIIVCICRESK